MCLCVLPEEEEAHNKSMDEAFRLRFFNNNIEDEKGRLKRDVHSVQNGNLSLLSHGKTCKRSFFTPKRCVQRSRSRIKQATMVGEKLETQLSVAEKNFLYAREEINDLKEELLLSRKSPLSLSLGKVTR